MLIPPGAFWELGHSSREKGVYLDLSIVNDCFADPAKSPHGWEGMFGVVSEGGLSTERSLGFLTLSESLYQYLDFVWSLSLRFSSM